MRVLQKTRIVSVRDETPRVRELVLEHALRDRLQPFSAGAHVTVALLGGTNRQYSLCGDPNDATRYRLGVLLTDDSRGGSRAIHALCPGDTLFVSYPRNSFALADEARHHVLLAGGIGVTPILSMAMALAAGGHSFEVHYGARSTADLGFSGDLRRICPPDRLYLYADDSATGRPDFAGILSAQSQSAHVYACGPAPMLTALFEAAEQIGFPPTCMHKEEFSAIGASERYGDPFDIRIDDSGEIVHVASNQTALEALRAAGHVVPSSCEGGICGECRLDLIEGAAIHQDKVLSETEAQSAFISCVSRSKGEIVLALPPQPAPPKSQVTDGTEA